MTDDQFVDSSSPVTDDQFVDSSSPVADDRFVEPASTRRERRTATVDRWLPFLFLVPALSLVVGFVLYPVLFAFKLSFFEVNLLAMDDQTFVGVDHYAAILADPTFAHVLWNTVVFVVASVLGQFAIGFGLALALDRTHLPTRVRRVFRVAYVLPWATTGVIVAYSWQFMFDVRLGLVNGLLRWLGVGNPPGWTASVEWAMVAVVVATIWRGVPFSLIFQTSALQSIPDRLSEAARVGGATPLQTLRHVTVPLLWPFVVMNLVLVTLFTLNVFDIVFVMTGGGPLDATNVLSLHMYETAFDLGQFGRANALAVVLFALNVLIVGVAVVAFDRGGTTR